MNLVVLCPYPAGKAPSQRLKYEQYFESWSAAGWSVDVRPFWDEAAWEALYRPGLSLRKIAGFLRGLLRRRADRRAASRADLVYLHLEAVPLGPPWIERSLARAGIPIVYDIDDLIHLPHSSGANPFMRRLRPTGKVSELVRLARVVVVCTEYLAEYARRWNPRVHNISSTIDTDAYVPRETGSATQGVVVGWSGSHSTSPYLHLLDDVLRELHASDGIRLTVIGDPGFSLSGVPVDARAWALEREVADLAEIDIGVYPLPDAEWVLGKSGLKALQYMGMGIPTVAERIGTNPTIIRDGENGLLASTPEEWRDAIRLLVRDPALRHRLGQAGRRTVEERYSVNANAPRYLEVLREAMRARG